MSTAKNKITKIIEIMQIFPIELLKQQHNANISPQEIIFPVKMARMEYLTFRSVNPAIRLLDHTPVRGNGKDANPQSVKYLRKVV